MEVNEVKSKQKKRTKYNKLVRDKIPNIMIQNGQAFKCHTVKDDDLINALSMKLKEECTEVQRALFYLTGDQFFENSRNAKNPRYMDFVKEMADLMLVYQYLAKTMNLDKKLLKEVYEKKNEERGKFDDGIFLEWSEEPECTSRESQ